MPSPFYVRDFAAFCALLSLPAEHGVEQLPRCLAVLALLCQLLRILLDSTAQTTCPNPARRQIALRQLGRLTVDFAHVNAAPVSYTHLDVYKRQVNGLSRGMEKAGELYEQEEYFVPELLICSDAMYNGLDVLRPHLPKDASRGSVAVVIGVVQGDTHDIGKNLVKIMPVSYTHLRH